MYIEMFVIHNSINCENGTNLEGKGNFNGISFHLFYTIILIYTLVSIPG